MCFLRVKKICKAYLFCSEAKDTVVIVLRDFRVSHNYLQSWPWLLLDVCFLKPQPEVGLWVTNEYVLIVESKRVHWLFRIRDKMVSMEKENLGKEFFYSVWVGVFWFVFNVFKAA